MADEENNEGAGEDAGEPNTGTDPRHDQHLVRTRKERDGWKQKATAAEQRLAEIEAKEREALAAKEREAGEWTKIEQRYETRVRDLEEKLAEANGTIEGFHRERRHGSITDRLMTDGGISNRKLVQRLLPDIGLADADPEQLTDRDYTRALKDLRREAPELFSATNASNTTKPPPGAGARPTEKDDDYFKRAAAARSSRGPSAAYDKARGRTG